MARPTFKPTSAQKASVAIAAGGGMSHEEIAIALSISRNTLEKHFEAELSHGSLKKRLETLVAMHAAAKKGNVAAQKAYLALNPVMAATPYVDEGKDKVAKSTGEAATKPGVPLGKKEQANVDAQTAQQGTSWESLLTTGGPVQ